MKVFGEALILLGLLVIVGYALSGACEMVWYALGAA